MSSPGPAAGAYDDLRSAAPHDYLTMDKEGEGGKVGGWKEREREEKIEKERKGRKGKVKELVLCMTFSTWLHR